MAVIAALITNTINKTKINLASGSPRKTPISINNIVPTAISDSDAEFDSYYSFLKSLIKTELKTLLAQSQNPLRKPTK